MKPFRVNIPEFQTFKVVTKRILYNPVQFRDNIPDIPLKSLRNESCTILYHSGTIYPSVKHYKVKTKTNPVQSCTNPGQ